MFFEKNGSIFKLLPNSSQFSEQMALAQVSIELIAIDFHSLEIFNIQIEEMTFCKPDFIIIKSNYFQSAQKGQCFLDDFEALVREIVILKLVSSKNVLTGFR
jgi:hypothetical protein